MTAGRVRTSDSSAAWVTTEPLTNFASVIYILTTISVGQGQETQRRHVKIKWEGSKSNLFAVPALVGYLSVFIRFIQIIQWERQDSSNTS